MIDEVMVRLGLDFVCGCSVVGGVAMWSHCNHIPTPPTMVSSSGVGVWQWDVARAEWGGSQLSGGCVREEHALGGRLNVCACDVMCSLLLCGSAVPGICVQPMFYQQQDTAPAPALFIP